MTLHSHHRAHGLNFHNTFIAPLFAICTCLCVVLCTGVLFAQDAARNVVKLDRAEVVFGQNTSIQEVKAIHDDNWQSVTLPFKPHAENADFPYIWFRIPLTQFGNTHFEAIYIANHAFDIEVYVNEQLVGEKHGPGNKYAMGWNIPLLFIIPDYLNGQPPQHLLIKLRQGKHFTFLPEIYLGDAEVLTQRFNQRYFFQVKAAEWGWVASILLGLFSLFLWFKRKHDVQYLQFSVLCFSWSMVLLYMILPFSPLAPDKWLKWGYANADIAGVALFFFINRMMDFSHQQAEKILAIAMIVLIGTYSLLPIEHAFYVVGLAHVLALLFVLYALAKTCVLSIKEQNTVARTISAGGAGVSMVMAYDIAAFAFSHNNDIALPDFTVMQHGFLFLLVIFFMLLVQRFIGALEKSEELNNTLEEKVKQISEALGKSYKESRLLEISLSAENERQSIMRDLHDDIGAKLLSITSSSNSAEQAELAREALISMKDMVSQANSLSNDINSTVITATTEMETRFENASIKVLLEADKTLDEIPVPPQTCYHLSRILREITTNILKHAKASEVFIRYQFSDVLTFEIRDNGVGMNINTQSGNGLRNIQFRLQSINGSMQIHSEAGVSISLTIPLQAA